MRVYISGPMSNCENMNYPAFFAGAEVVRQRGYEPINPADGAPEGWAWAQYMRRALRLLLDADEVWMLPVWQQSEGARLEYTVAKGLHMPVRYLSEQALAPTGNDASD